MAELEVVNSLNGISRSSTVFTSEGFSTSSSTHLEQNFEGESGSNLPEEERPNMKSESSLANESIAVLENHETSFIDQQKLKKAQMHATLTDKSKVPESYHLNSAKEDLVLSFAENFNRQYTQLYPGRKELLLCPPNEMGIKKFISNTIRPTQSPFKELYDYRSCAKFVSSFLNYEPLEPPHDLPKIIPSPSYTLKMQSGNSFDLSIVLASFLTGAGYDAYVVSGYAEKAVTVMDRAKNENFDVSTIIPKPAEIIDLELEAAVKNVSTNLISKYKVKPTRQLKSQFMIKQEARARDKKDTSIKQIVNDKVGEEETEDELKGLRIHAWVLILPGRREISEPFFIESSTGDIYPIDHEYYSGVESVFSSSNFWVNMQVCFDGLKGISFDLADHSKWEFVFLGNNKPRGIRASFDPEKADADVGSDDEDNQESDVLDLPPSWVEKLKLSKEQFESKCPSGSKTYCYKNVKCEIFAEYFRPDGMVLRVTELQGPDAGKVTEYFENRKDRLRERRRLDNDQFIYEFFLPGKLHGLKQHIMEGRNSKEMHFYPNARSDGLYLRTEIANKIIEKFVDREDKLFYRSIRFEPFEQTDNIIDGGITDHLIKVTEKYEANDDNIKPTDAYKKTYFVKDERIKIVYQCQSGSIIPSFREFKKHIADQKGINIEVLHEFSNNPFSKSPKKQHLYMELSDLQKSESACLQSIKLAEKEIKTILSTRSQEESDISLTISVYDTIRNNSKLPSDSDYSNVKEVEESKNSELDYLSPFLINYENPDNLSREDSIAIKDACLKSLKERLIEKANIIQTKLDEITSEYQQKQISYSKNADSLSPEETDDYVNFCSAALFKIHVLEKRLATHKENAPEKYIELDSKLRSDPRLHL